LIVLLVVANATWSGLCVFTAAVLRSRRGAGWIQSEAVPVTIDGREQQSWLLAAGAAAVLVVEVDDTVLHVSVSPDTDPASPVSAADRLRGPVRAALAQLVRDTTVKR